MRRRRIAHVLPFPGIGGTEHATLRIARAAETRGFESVIVSLHDTAEIKSFFQEFPLSVQPAPGPSIRHALNYFRQARALASEFKRLKADLVHCSDILAGYQCALAGRMAGVPVLCHVRNRLEEMPHLGRLHLRPVSHFAFVSKHTWAQFPLYVPPGKGTVIYDGVDSAPGDPASDALHAAAAAQVRAEFGFPDGAKLVGMVARVVPQKDYATMIAAASRVVHAHPEVRFLVVGDHSGTEISRAHYAEIRAILDRSGMTPWFVFTGYRRDVPGFLDAFDIAVLSTHHEGLPLVLLESMARARPTVATAVDGIPELIDGTNGLLHPHGDAEALAAHLLNLLDHPEAGARIGRAARQTVLEKFTTRQFTDCIVELYTRMLPG